MALRRRVRAVVAVVILAGVVAVGGMYMFLASPLRSPLSSSPSPTAPTPSPGSKLTSAIPEWTAALEPGLNYSEPVLGPTTPLSDAYGGLWVINAAREGIVEMNLTQMHVAVNENPFTIANASRRLDVARDLGESATPLEAAYYIVPAADAANGSTGPFTRNGALALFAGSDFLAADPFNDSVFFRARLAFTPTWTGEDPASAGNLLIAPSQLTESVGLLSVPVGPYRYFWASDGNHSVVLEVTYVHGGACPCAAPSGQLLLSANASLTAPPFVYYDQFAVTQSSGYRSGPGATIALPLANDTLELLDTVPRVRAWIPLTLGGQPAEVAGPMGVVQSSYPCRLLVPLRSASSSGLLALDLATLSPAFTYVAGGAGLQPVGTPVSRTGSAMYLAWYDPGSGDTRFVGLNGTGAAIPEFSASVPGPTVSLFPAYELNAVFAQGSDGRIVTLNTTYASSANVTPRLFPLGLPSARTVVLYGGSPGGTRFGADLGALELRGAWTSSGNATTALFQLLPPRPSVATLSVPAMPAAGWVLAVPSGDWAASAAIVVGLERLTT